MQMSTIPEGNGFSFPEYMLLSCLHDDDEVVGGDGDALEDMKIKMKIKIPCDVCEHDPILTESQVRDVFLPSMLLSQDNVVNEVRFDHRTDLQDHDLRSLRIDRIPDGYVLKMLDILLDHVPVASIEYPPLGVNLLPRMVCDEPYVIPTSKLYYQTIQFRFTYEDQYETVTQIIKHPIYSQDTHHVYDGEDPKQSIKELKIVIGYRDVINTCQKNKRCISPEMSLGFIKARDENIWCEGPPLNIRLWNKTNVYKEDLNSNYLLTLLQTYDMPVEDYINAVRVLSDKNGPICYGVFVKNSLMLYEGKGMLTVNFDR
jgi:hypothetical protein